MAVIKIGNSVAPQTDGEKRRNWVFYVRGATDCVKEVVVMLHPTFKNPRRVLRGPDFELKTSGWGTFDLDVEVKWLGGGAPEQLTWGLQFDKEDSYREVTVPAAFRAAADAAGGAAASAAAPTGVATAAADAAGSAAASSAAPTGFATAAAGDSRSQVEAEPVSDDEPPRGAKASSPKDASPQDSRDTMCEGLRKCTRISHGDPLFMHGRAYRGPVEAPRCTWECAKPPRDDHSAPKWLTASEFQDQPNVTKAKCQQLAQLIRMSRKTVAYTGAGISAAVVGQAARSGQNVVGFKPEPKKAKPTFTHHALGLLGQQGLIHSWVQQNHDGLPQKAGFPQENINEVHGSWYDPSNPVVKYSGSLHDRAYPWMEDDADTADLVVVLGTSLGGLNADQVATKAADRADRGRSLGAVCINLQQTARDGTMSLRLFGKSDDVLKGLLQELGFGAVRFSSPAWPSERRALVPYGADGVRLPPGEDKRKMWLDLSDRARIRITPGHNIQGAKQPQFMHIGARKPYKHPKTGEVVAPAEGLGTVVRRDDDTASYVLMIEGATMHLGVWWLEVAARGGVEALPVVNAAPKFQVAKD